MRFLKSLLSHQGGMTIAEMTLAVGLTGVAALGVASLMKSMGGSGKDAERVIERTEFGSAMGVFLNSARGCYRLQQGPVIGTAVMDYETQEWTEPATGKKKNFTFDGFQDFNGNTSSKPGDDLRFNHVKSFTAQRKDIPNVNPITLKVSGVSQTLKKAVINIKLVLTEKSISRDPVAKAADEAKFPETRFEYNVPVLYDTSSMKVEICGDNSTMAEACFALKGVFDTTTGKCDLPTNCESFGSYSYINCAPKYKSYASCADYSHGKPTPNPVTGGFSCPSGSTPVSTGGTTWYKTVDCGKKCTARINYAMGYYSCLKCE